MNARPELHHEPRQKWRVVQWLDGTRIVEPHDGRIPTTVRKVEIYDTEKQAREVQ